MKLGLVMNVRVIDYGARCEQHLPRSGSCLIEDGYSVIHVLTLESYTFSMNLTISYHNYTS